MRPDRAYVIRALADLRRWVTYLRQAGPLEAKALRDDLTRQLAVLHALQLCIQIVLDVGAHLLAASGAPPVGDYADIGSGLAAAHVVDADLGGRISQMARFRNVVVHQYREVDLDLVAENSARGLADFDAFAAAALGLLDRTPGS